MLFFALEQVPLPDPVRRTKSLIAMPISKKET